MAFFIGTLLITTLHVFFLGVKFTASESMVLFFQYILYVHFSQSPVYNTDWLLFLASQQALLRAEALTSWLTFLLRSSNVSLALLSQTTDVTVYFLLPVNKHKNWWTSYCCTSSLWWAFSVEQLNGSVKEPNISIYFFFRSCYSPDGPSNKFWISLFAGRKLFTKWLACTFSILLPHPTPVLLSCPA